jgi:hypothetical protein
LIAAFRSDPEATLEAAQRALTVAEARGDEKMALSSLLVQPPSLAQRGDVDGAIQLANEVLDRAKRYGHPTMVAAAVVINLNLYAWSLDEPDFATCLAIIERERIGHSGGEVGALWLDLIRAYARFGVNQPGAVEDFADVARAADRLAAPHVFERALMGLAVVAAEGGLIDPAYALLAFAEDRLSLYRVGEFGQDWIQSRLDRALHRRPDAARPAPAQRSEIIAVVDDIEAALSAPSPRRPERGTPTADAMS